MGLRNIESESFVNFWLVRLMMMKKENSQHYQCLHRKTRIQHRTYWTTSEPQYKIRVTTIRPWYKNVKPQVSLPIELTCDYVDGDFFSLRRKNKALANLMYVISNRSDIGQHWSLGAGVHDRSNWVDFGVVRLVWRCAAGNQVWSITRSGNILACTTGGGVKEVVALHRYNIDKWYIS